MSTAAATAATAAASSAATPSGGPAGFLDRLAIYLMPYFLAVTPDRSLAHGDIVEALRSCGARTRYELILAAKAMACDLSALDMLAESKIMDMSASMRLRYAACAGGLGRLGRQTQQTLDRRLSAEPAQSGAAAPAPAEPALAERVNGIADAEVEAALRTMQADVQAFRERLAPAQPIKHEPASSRLGGASNATAPMRSSLHHRHRGSPTFTAGAEALVPRADDTRVAAAHSVSPPAHPMLR